MADEIIIHPVTPERWADLETLFGPQGACSGCWCMYWRLKRSEFDQLRPADKRSALQEITASGEIPGLLAYVDGQPAGWCSVGPRSVYPALDRSWLLKPVDDRPAWAVVCFYVGRRFRHQGLTVALLQSAVEHARRQGATLIEGYPVDPPSGTANDLSAYTGLLSAFQQVGFHEVLRRKATRPIMRLELTPEE